jgi:hypothetical protein
MVRSCLFGASLLIVAVAGCSSDSESGGGSGTGASSGSGGSGTSGSAGAGGGAGVGGSGDAGVCGLPMEVGDCEGAFPRWWFNAAVGKCEVFSYGGCNGNANNFETAEACAAACAPGVANPCDAVSCGSITSCVFVGGALSCSVPCAEGCAANAPCGCASSCPTCKDCVQVCGGN